MRQRLGIAAALLNDPPLLLLDEPANGLDPAGIADLRRTFRDLAAAGKTVFVSSHLLAEVRVLADVVGIIAAGRLVREGTLDSMLRDQGIVRVRVPRASELEARALLEPVGRTEVAEGGNEDPWLAVHVDPHRAGEVNRLLAEAGIYASGLESGTDLEDLFLELTSGGEESGEGGFGKIASPDSRGAAQLGPPGASA
jgi:ABC-2 type transport system ATP-binding protein